MKLRIFIVFTLLGLFLSACASSSGPDLQIQEPWVRAAAMMGMQSGEAQDAGEGEISQGDMGQMGGANSGAFMLIKNNGNQADQLIGAESDVAQTVEIHLSEMKDDVMTMRQVDGVDIPAKGQAELKPGGYHVMLIGIKHDLKEGDLVTITLVFEISNKMTVEAEVRMP